VGYRESNLWQAAFDPPAGTKHPAERDRLRVALDSMRDRAATLSERIAVDLPDFTMHDGTHSDALWETADLVLADPQDLNPADVFVFGAAVLLHDLGLSVAAYPSGRLELRDTQTWRDAIGLVLRRDADEYPENLKDPPARALTDADYLTLRRLHASRAAELMSAHWPGANEESIYLLDDYDLREQLGWSIGRIAASHWWPASRLPTLGTELLSVPLLPTDWPLDRIAVGCLLRLADILHVDQRRAPWLRRALQSPSGNSKTHWDAQNRLARPTRNGDVIVLSSSRPFPVEATHAWWQAWSAAQGIDRELRAVDSTLISTNRKRFAARTVRGMDRPESFARYVVAEGWDPIPASVRVSNVAAVARTLGGRSLYGSEAPFAPLRELVQNGMDAVRARRSVHPDIGGAVTVRISPPADDFDVFTATVSDNGVGMSQAILADVLLDFGRTLWTSDELLDLPRVASSSFSPTGRFGIGFFSVFIWGRQIRVVTRSGMHPRAATFALDMEEGLDGPVVLRELGDEEQKKEPGTSITVALETDECDEIYSLINPKVPTDASIDPFSNKFHNASFRNGWHDDGFGPPLERPGEMGAFIRWLAPGADVRIRYDDDGKVATAIERDWWLSSPGVDLLRGLYPVADHIFRQAEGGDVGRQEEWDKAEEDFRRWRQEHEQELYQRLTEAAERLVLVKDLDGSPLGRMAADPGIQGYLSDGLVATTGGLRVNSFGNAVGLAAAHDPNTARNEARLQVSTNEIAAWASRQAELYDAQKSHMQGATFEYMEDGRGTRDMHDHNDLIERIVRFAHFVISAGGDPGGLPVGFTRQGLVSTAALGDWIRDRRKFAVVDHSRPFECAPNVAWMPLAETPWSAVTLCEWSDGQPRRPLDWLLDIATKGWQLDRCDLNVSDSFETIGKEWHDDHLGEVMTSVTQIAR
jgi:hypothetical protein